MHITMDRYNADWPMVARGWNAHVHGQGQPFRSATEAIAHLYAADPHVDDQYLPAFVITDADGAPIGPITTGDAVLMFNFRGDRAIEISRAFTERDLDTFDRGDAPDVLYAGMMQYDGDLKVPEHFLVQPPHITEPVGQLLCEAGQRSFACSETQKYGHVTYFFNGNRSAKFSETLETYLEIPSDNRPFDEAPWMKAAEITDALLEALASGAYDHLRVNYPNGDMVGHTGNLNATKVAMSCVALQLGRLVDAGEAAGAILLITADHGNAAEMYMRKKGVGRTNEHGMPLPKTSHTLRHVPFLLVDPRAQWELKPQTTPPASIASVGTTLLELAGLTPPKGWEPSLVDRLG